MIRCALRGTARFNLSASRRALGQTVRLAGYFHVWERGSNDDGFAERLTMTIGYQCCEQVVAMPMRTALELRTILLRPVTGIRINRFVRIDCRRHFIAALSGFHHRRHHQRRHRQNSGDNSNGNQSMQLKHLGASSEPKSDSDFQITPPATVGASGFSRPRTSVGSQCSEMDCRSGWIPAVFRHLHSF